MNRGKEGKAWNENLETTYHLIKIKLTQLNENEAKLNLQKN